VLRVDHARLEALLLEAPAPEEVENLYEALFEAAVRVEAMEDLDAILRGGGDRALEVDLAEHARRVAGFLAVPQAPPARQRTGPGFGVLRSLFGQDGPLLLSAPSHQEPGAERQIPTVCPACTGRVPVGHPESRVETSAGAHSVHAVGCPRCLAAGTLERYTSHRLRGIRDRVRLARTGWLGPLASRRGCARFARACLGLSALLLPLEAPVLPAATVGLWLWIRVRLTAGGWLLAWSAVGVLAGLLGVMRDPGPGWALALVVLAAAGLHAMWAMVACPSAWEPEEASARAVPGTA
jgi:hypothetical protein